MSYQTMDERPELAKIMDEEIARIKATVKQDEQVLLALSGGVDSFVTAVMIHKAIGSRLKCVFVDHGGMRKNEADEIKKLFSERFGDAFIAIDAGTEYLDAINGIEDSEELRKIIGAKFIDVFNSVAGKMVNVRYFGQGTIKTDLDETKAGIKTHHNTGINDLVNAKGWTLIEPLKRLMKPDVRTVGSWLGIPEEHLERQPFPGPGNYLRVVGGSIVKEDLEKVAEFDAIVRNVLGPVAKSLGAKQYFGALLKNAIFFDGFYAPDDDSKILANSAQEIASSIMHSYDEHLDYGIKIAPKVTVTCIREGRGSLEPVISINNGAVMRGIANLKNTDFEESNLHGMQCKLANEITSKLPIGRVMFESGQRVSMTSGDFFVVRAVGTDNFKNAVPVAIPHDLQYDIIEKLFKYAGEQSILFDMTSKPSGTIEYR